MYTSRIYGTTVFVEKDGNPSFSWRCETKEESETDQKWFEQIKDNDDAVTGFILMLNERHPEEWDNVKKTMNRTWSFLMGKE